MSKRKPDEEDEEGVGTESEVQAGKRSKLPVKEELKELKKEPFNDPLIGQKAREKSGLPLSESPIGVAGMFAKIKNQEEKKPMQRSEILLEVKNYVAKINENMLYDLNSFKDQYESISRLPLLLADQPELSPSITEMINKIRKFYSDSNVDLLVHYVESSTAVEALREFSGIREAVSKMKIELGQLKACLGEKGKIISPAIEKMDVILKLLQQMGVSLKNYYSTHDSNREDSAVSDKFLESAPLAHKPAVGLSDTQ